MPIYYPTFSTRFNDQLDFYLDSSTMDGFRDVIMNIVYKRDYEN